MNTWKDTDEQVPGGIYLCQVNETVACGACCGLYNVADPSREALNRMLIRRTVLFKTVRRDCDAIEAFGRQMAAEADGSRPFPEFHHCPYVGLIGPAHSRVGCLLHPLAEGNNGADFRGLSYYGGLACRAYFCPSCRRVPKLFKDLICRAAADWYDYGLIITEAALLCALCDQLRLSINSSAGESAHTDAGTCLAIGRKLLNLKITWPFQTNPALDRVNYFFKDNLYTRPAVQYGDAADCGSRYDEIFKNLVSTFHTADQLRLAEAMMDTLIDEIAKVYHYEKQKAW
jgi:hypothetical protein